VGVEQENVELFLMWLVNELPKNNLSDYQFEGEADKSHMVFSKVRYGELLKWEVCNAMAHA
jgi:hypothetical protein